MGKALIIGAGGVGRVVAYKCAQNPDVFEEIMIASRTKSKCDQLKKELEGGKAKIYSAQVDADSTDDVINLINSFKPDIVINVALPYQDLAIMDACLATKTDYVDTANYEPPEIPKFEYKWQWAYKEKYDYAGDTDRFFSSFTDACLMAQNVVTAAESLGLGTIYLGSILNDTEKMCQLLKLPELTFPVLGLGLGYPNQSPQLKPRMEMRLRVFENAYTFFDSYLDEIKDHDEEMRTYYDLREPEKPVDSFSDQVVSRLKYQNIKRQELLKVARKQGFDLKV